MQLYRQVLDPVDLVGPQAHDGAASLDVRNPLRELLKQDAERYSKAVKISGAKAE